MSYRSPWAAIAEFAQGFAPVLDQTVQRFQQQAAYNGQQAQTQVQEYVGQAEGALADPNYQWKPGEREAAEAFVTQAKQITAADPTQAAGMWADLQKRGIKIPTTAIKQGPSGQGMTEEKTLTPYEGGISGFFGDVNSGVAQAGQQQAEYEKDLDLARQLQLNGQEQAYQTQRDAMLQKYGQDNAQLQADLGAEQFTRELGAQESIALADSYITNLGSFAGSTDPNDQALVQDLLKEARGAGLSKAQLGRVEATARSLGSTAAQMDYQARSLELGLSEQAVRMGEQSITLNGQQIKLNESIQSNTDYLNNRQYIEDVLEDKTTFEELITSAVANGDDKEINNMLNILDAGGTVNPEIYEALTKAGYTPEVLEEALGDAVRSENFIARSDELDIAETDAAFTKLRTGLNMDAVEVANAQSVFLEGVSSRMSAEEIAANAADPKTQLGALYADGLITDADLRAAKRNAGFHMALRSEELNAPVIERTMNLLETFAAVPSNPDATLNSLTGTLERLVDLKAIDEGDVQGIISQYQRAWEVGAREQEAGIASTIASTAYTEALTSVQRKSLTAVAAEPGAWGDQQKEQLAALNTSFDGTRDDIKAQYSECFDSASGMAGTPQCEIPISLLEENRVNRIRANQQILGVLAPEDSNDTLLQMAAGVQNEVLQDPTFADADPARIEHEVDRRMFEITGEGDPGPWVEPTETTRQGNGIVGGLGNALGQLNSWGLDVERRVTGTNSGTAQARPAPSDTPARPTAQAAPAPPKTPPPALASNPAFGQLVDGIKKGDMQPSMMRAIASTLAQDSSLGLTTSDIVEMAEAMTRDGTETDGFVSPWNQ